MGLCCRDVPRNDAGLNRPGANNPIREDSQWASDPVEGVAEDHETLALDENLGASGVLDVRGILGGPGPFRGKATMGAGRELSIVPRGRDSEKP